MSESLRTTVRRLLAAFLLGTGLQAHWPAAAVGVAVLAVAFVGYDLWVDFREAGITR